MKSAPRLACLPWIALLLIAGVVVAAWAAMHLAGWREHTGLFSVVSFTEAGQEQALVKAVVYAGFHLLLVLVVPVLAVAALILRIVEPTRR